VLSEHDKENCRITEAAAAWMGSLAGLPFVGSVDDARAPEVDPAATPFV
jgi:hypothetical protein